MCKDPNTVPPGQYGNSEYSTCEGMDAFGTWV